MVPSMTCPEAFIPDWSANTTVCPGVKVEKLIKREVHPFYTTKVLYKSGPWSTEALTLSFHHDCQFDKDKLSVCHSCHFSCPFRFMWYYH